MVWCLSLTKDWLLDQVVKSPVNEDLGGIVLCPYSIVFFSHWEALPSCWYIVHWMSTILFSNCLDGCTMSEVAKEFTHKSPWKWWSRVASIATISCSHITWRWWSWLQYDRRVNKTITEILLDVDNTVGRRVLIIDFFPFASQYMCALVLSALLRSFSTCTMLCFLREDQNKAPNHCRVMYSLMDRVIKTITEVLRDVDNTVRRGVLISSFFSFKSQHTCMCPGLFCIPLSFVNLQNAGSREKTRPKLCSCSFLYLQCFKTPKQ